MHAVIINDRQLKIAVEGGGRYWMPFHASKPERDETAIVKVGPPLAGIGAPLSTAFQLPCPNPTAAYSRTHKTKHKSRTAAVILITKLEGIL